jgi:hypothetical protein
MMKNPFKEFDRRMEAQWREKGLPKWEVRRQQGKEYFVGRFVCSYVAIYFFSSLLYKWIRQNGLSLSGDLPLANYIGLIIGIIFHLPIGYWLGGTIWEGAEKRYSKAKNDLQSIPPMSHK